MDYNVGKLGGFFMTNTSANNFKQNAFEYLDLAIDFNDVVNVSTNNGNAILMSEEDYNGLLETLYLLSVPKMKDNLIDSLKEPLESMVDVDTLGR